MLPQADQYTLDSLKANADIVLEVDESNMYLGFCKPGTDGTNEEKKAQAIWSIIKVTETITDPETGYPKETEVNFAGGVFSYGCVWNDYATYNYIYKKI
jgi:hypothetical protein